MDECVGQNGHAATEYSSSKLHQADYFGYTQIVVVGSQSSGKSSGMLLDVSPAMRTSTMLIALLQ
jgi:hypothetical protein